MLLKRCHVQGFGKLQDFTYEFSEGLNVICTENGWGKSTFAAFLRAMFYGLPAASARTRLEEAERRKYRPWTGGVMGGSLVFEVNGKEYKAERTFGKKEAEDTFRLIDLSTNLDSADFSSELGKELFGLDKEAYSRSTYLPQNKISDGGMNDSIGKKLGKLAEGEEEDGNFDKAYETLEELRKKYIPDRQKDEKGYVAELTRKLREAQAGLENCRRKQENAKPWREKELEAAGIRKEAQAQLAACRERLEAAAGYEAVMAKKQHYTELCGQEEALRIRKESMEGLFRAGIPSPGELRVCRQSAEEAAVLAGELRSYRLTPEEQTAFGCMRNKFAGGVPDRERIQACIRLGGESRDARLRAEQLYFQEKEKAERYKKTKAMCLVPAVVLLLLTVVLGILAFVTKATPGLCAASGVVFLVFLITGLRTKKEEKTVTEQLKRYTAEIEQLRKQEAQGAELLSEYEEEKTGDVTADLYRLWEEAGRYEALAEKWEKQEQCDAKRNCLLQECTGLLTRYGMETEDLSGSLHILENRTGEYVRISEELAEAARKREHFEGENPPELFLGLSAPEISFRELQEREQELLVRIARASEEEKDCRERAERFEEEAEECAEFEELCEELQTTLEAKKRAHFFVTETIKCLKTAKEQFSSRYLRGLTAGFDRYVEMLGKEDVSESMGGHFGGARTDIDLKVQVTAYGEEKELGYFSTGTRDLLGLCMRFALVDALFSEERPFLVLDDPFVNLDKDKIERAVAFLKEASERYQILYLVCHESRA